MKSYYHNILLLLLSALSPGSFCPFIRVIKGYVLECDLLKSLLLKILDEKSVERKVLMLEVHCNYINLGCQWIGQLQSLDVSIGTSSCSKVKQFDYCRPKHSLRADAEVLQN